MFPNLENLAGRVVLTDIFSKDFTVQMVHCCTTLNKLRAVGQGPLEKCLWSVLIMACGNHSIKKAGAHAQNGHTWRVCTEVTVTSCTVLNSLNAVGCPQQVRTFGMRIRLCT